jgi:hypothetical protein
MLFSSFFKMTAMIIFATQITVQSMIERMHRLLFGFLLALFTLIVNHAFDKDDIVDHAFMLVMAVEANNKAEIYILNSFSISMPPTRCHNTTLQHKNSQAHMGSSRHQLSASSKWMMATSRLRSSIVFFLISRS